MTFTKFTPRLVVANAEEAIEFYRQVFDASPGLMMRTPTGSVAHAELDMGGARLSLTESDGKDNRSPGELGGSPVILTWVCDDPDAVERRAIAAGGVVHFPVEDRFYGMRDGRFEDIAGHLWIVSKPLVSMSSDELEKAALENM